MEDIEETVNKILNSNSIKSINDKIILTNYEINILDAYKIDYKNCKTMKELLCLIDSFINFDNYDELEEILITISERSYYMDTRR